MSVTFCGVRGSAPSPGPEFVRHGGNTSCVAIARGGADPHLVLDGGTGLARVRRRAIREEDFPQRRTFIHSAGDYPVGLARAAGARRLALFHHDPGRTDEQFDAIARAWGVTTPEVSVAREQDTRRVEPVEEGG